MATQSNIELMPPPTNPSNASIENIEDLDLSVLFPIEKSTTPDFVWEISSILADMHKDRDAIKEYCLELATKLDEQTISFGAKLEAKEKEMQRCVEDHRQKEEEWKKNINELRSKVESLESQNHCNSAYFTNLIENVIDIIVGGKDFLESVKQNEMNEARAGGNVETIAIPDESDEEQNERLNECDENVENLKPPTGIEHPHPLAVSKDDFNMTEDGSIDNNNDKENAQPTLMDIEIQTVVDKTAKAAKTVTLCKWCHISVPKKLLSKHKWDVHKVPQKEKSTIKIERVLKRKNDDDDQSESDVSIICAVRPSLATIRQGIVKPKKAKNMATSSPV